ncbi:MAG TPA: DUF3604 domain-containing protein [Steroidobacteraceae bacterium]|nr:DUF3604 domain-containing protein [Steroidobacteraceae bacterium]
MKTTALQRSMLVAVLAVLFASTLAAQTAPARQARTPAYNRDRTAYFGDLHVHTKLSFDAYIFNVRATPDDAYRYAKGESLHHAGGYDVRLTDAPLDFLAVTDHSEYLGILPAMNDPQHPLSKIPYAPDLFSTDRDKINAAFQRIGTSIRTGQYLPELKDPQTFRSAWRSIVESAERHYVPGRFTTFRGYEYTSAPDGQNLHRNVIFGSARSPEQPFTALDSQNPEELWRWMDQQRARGMEVLAIPHNSNGSDGRMFQRVQWDGRPIDRSYAELRMRNEPLAEITQVKGTSETHPSLSPNDEWSAFEIMDTYIGSATKVTKFSGGYLRDALKTGLELQQERGVNPYRFGFVGASDTHNAAGPFEENRYFSKVGVLDATPQQRGSVPPPNQTWENYEPQGGAARYQTWGASGLTGVWAEENTREAIFAALRRKETFATSGPRMRVRFFAGYGLPDGLENRLDMVAHSYTHGVPMGADLLQRGTGAPRFLAWALRDPHAGWLQRVQIVKGWIENGKAQERVFDVACSDGLTPDATTHRCADNDATVDLRTCGVSENKGAVELRALWSDPTFDPRQRAFYYVRVLENPSCRWSTWDAMRAGVEPNPQLPKTIQERAWSSPIWYVPQT